MIQNYVKVHVKEKEPITSKYCPRTRINKGLNLYIYATITITMARKHKKWANEQTLKASLPSLHTNKIVIYIYENSLFLI